MSNEPARRRCAGRLVFSLVVLASFFTAPATAKEDRWLKVEGASFTLLTTLSERDAVVCATEFSLFFQGIKEVIAVDPKRLPPLTIVVFAKKAAFKPYALTDEKGRPLESDGFMVSWQTSWAVGGISYPGFARVRPVLFRQGAYWLLGASKKPLPQWLTLGLTEMFSSAVISEKRTEWGHPIDSYMDYFMTTGPLRVEQLLCADDVKLDSGETTYHRYATCWAFTHFLFFGDHGMGENPLGAYLRKWNAGATREAAFAEVFGVYRDSINQKLDDYIRAGRYRIALRQVVPMAPLQPITASAAEVEAACARLADAAKRSDLAQKHLARWLELAPDDPNAHEMQGMICNEKDDEPGTLAAFQRAFALGSTSSALYFAVGDHFYGEAEGLLDSLAREKCREALNLYARGLALAPQSPVKKYDRMVMAYVRSDTDVTAIRAQVEKGAELYPESGALAAATAELLWRDGKHREARDRLTEILRVHQDSAEVISLGQRLLENWNRTTRESQAPTGLGQQLAEPRGSREP